ncbi:hypothetical protein HYR53_01720 [Candidatus Acetothermia bacterium]|nr:hypothetical protein [Candidatus Acetothermia bacterium]
MNSQAKAIPQSRVWLMVGLIVAAMVLYVMGGFVERNAMQGNVTQEASEVTGQHNEATEQTQTEAAYSETLLGVNLESPAVMVVVVLVWGALIGGLVLGRRWVWGLVAFLAAAFAIIDIREFFFQLTESHSTVAIIAGLVAALHLIVAGLAYLTLRASGPAQLKA